jgi:hypothetical protein
MRKPLFTPKRESHRPYLNHLPSWLNGCVKLTETRAADVNDHYEEMFMEFGMLISGLGLAIGGALLLAIADAWLSRSILVYLDAIESNVAAVATALRASNTQLAVTGINLMRDRGQNRARALKTLGWFTMAFGFGLQLAASLLTKG